jgi:ribosome-binding protein aMBF1 (putative translation factor)
MSKLNAQELAKLYGWEETSPELLAMLAEFSDPEIAQGGLAKPVSQQATPSSGWTPQQIRETVDTEVALEQAGKLIEQARAKRGMSTRELARKVGVSQPRVMQVQGAGDSLNLATLVKFASALGYHVRLELVPDEGGEPLRTH